MRRLPMPRRHTSGGTSSTFSSQPLTIGAGGADSARAEDNSGITLTGSGTFVAPAGGAGRSSAVTGGGTWETFDKMRIPTGDSGAYQVTGLVRWDEAPGTFPGADTNHRRLSSRESPRRKGYVDYWNRIPGFTIFHTLR